MEEIIAPTIISKEKGNKTLVFLHYFGGSAESWKWVMDLLAKDYTCIAFSLPGFGHTAISEKPSVEYYAQLIQRELDKLNIWQYTLIGHSMGGKIAVEIASHDEYKHIRQLILVAPSPPTIEKMSEEEQKTRLKPMDEEAAKERVRKITVKPLSTEKFNLAVNTQLVINQMVKEWWILQGMKIPVNRNPKYLTIPITVIASENDPCITPQMITEDVLPSLPDKTQFISCKDIGHLYPLEAPEWLAEIIELLVKTH